MGKFRKSEQLAYWRFFLLLFLAGFVLGIVFVFEIPQQVFRGLERKEAGE